MAQAIPEHIRGLLRRSVYAHPVPGLRLVQTHISFVILAGEHVYKLKKAVNLGFVDFTTLEKRKADCEAEVRLNTRACAGVYYGVLPVTRTKAGYRFGGEGEIVDYAVHMKRLPADRMMDRLLERGEVDFAMIGNLVARLADLHRSAATSDEITRIGGSQTLRENWRDNFDTVRRFVGRTLSARTFARVERYVDAFFRQEAELLARREREGRIRDCHGDLRSDAVCFDPSVPGGICIYDCIEFNDRFRYSDTGLDAAFLAMDLEYRGHRHLSDLFAGLYAEAAGDKEFPVLLDFYKCYRAWTRGKVESLLLEDAGVPLRQRAEARRRARAYFHLAQECAARHPRGTAVLVMGLSGSGKSVLAGVLASRLGAVLLASDMLRREAEDNGAQPGTPQPLDQGRYAPEARWRIYEELARQAGAFLRAGRSVVLDATFIERRQRDLVRSAVESAGAKTLVVECFAPEEVVRRRQEQRAAEAWTASEGRFEVYLAQKARLEPPDEIPEDQRLRIDTTWPLDEQIEDVEQKLALILGEARRGQKA